MQEEKAYEKKGKIRKKKGEGKGMWEIEKENQVISIWWTGEPYGNEGKDNMHVM